MSELTNVFARNMRDLTTPTSTGVNPNTFDNAKIPIGNAPKGFESTEALTVKQLKDLSSAGRKEELDVVTLKITEEVIRAKEVEAALIKDKANKATTLSGYGINDAYTQGQTDSKVNNLESKKANKVDVDTAFSNLSITANKYYSTLAAANADIANIALNQSVTIGEAANSGLWEKKTAGATSLTKSPYDPLNQAKAYTQAYADGNPLFKPVKITNKDLNTILESGIYTVTEQSSATLALNVPKNEIGFLLVVKSTLSNIVYQNYYASNTIFTRIYNGTSWSVWSDNGYKETVKNSRDILENRNIIETAFDMSSNIFSGAIPNTTTDPQGNIVADSIRWLGDFISCASGEVFSVSTSAYRISYYDENKVFISQISSAVITSFTVAPVNAKYFRLSGTKSLDAMQLNKGSALLPYEPFKLHPKFLPKQKIMVEPKQTSFFRFSSNLFDTELAQPNKTIDATGSTVSDDVRWLSDFIEVESGKTYSVPSAAYRIIEFKENKSFISLNSTAVISSFQITKPATKFIRLSSTTPLGAMQVNEGSDLLPYMPFGQVKIKDEFLPEQKTLPEQNLMVEPEQTTFFNLSSNLFDMERAESNKSMDAAGNVVSDELRWLSDFIGVESGKTYSVPSSSYRIIEFGGDKNFISINGTQVISNFQITKPLTKFIRLSSTMVTIPLSTMRMNEGSNLLPYEPFGVAKIKNEFLPEQGVDVEGLKQQLIAELTQTLLPKYNPSFPSLNFNESMSASELPRWMSSDGDIIYGSGGIGSRSLMQSTDDWETREQIGPAFSLSVMGVRTLDDGELLVATTRTKNPDVYSKIWKSVGYDKNNPSSTTFKEVLVSTNIDAFFINSWGMSNYQNIVLASEYGERGLATGAKHVYLSTDYGDSFNLVFNLYATQVDGRPTLTETAHLHTVAYDPYFNRIWVAVGDIPNTATYYSDDMGASWTYVTDSNAMQYTGIVALPDAVIFGSDRSPNGVHAYHRKDKHTMPKIEPLLKVNDLSTITHVFGLPFKKDWSPTSPVYFSAPTIQNTTDYAPCIVATVDGKKAFKIWEGNKGDNLIDTVGPTASGKIIAALQVSAGDYIVMKALAPSWSKT